MKNTVITITEEYNSRGQEIAKLLAKELNFPYYKDEIIKMASKQFNISENIFYTIEEWDLNFLLPFHIDFGTYATFPNFIQNTVPLQDKTFNAKSEIVKNLANENCVIFCKCANYMLKNMQNCINVLIYSKDKDRIRIEQKNGSNLKKVKKIIRKKDKQVAKYYSYYTLNNWDNKKMYDILINSSKFGINASVDIIKNVVQECYF